MSKNLVVQHLVGIRAEAGNGFIAALDDIRQKVVEEGFFGRTATTAHELRVELSDPIAALYGRRQATAEANEAGQAGAERETTAVAYNQAVQAGATRTVGEIEAAVSPGTLAWLRGPMEPSQAAGQDVMGRTRAAEQEAADIEH